LSALHSNSEGVAACAYTGPDGPVQIVAVIALHLIDFTGSRQENTREQGEQMNGTESMKTEGWTKPLVTAHPLKMPATQRSNC